MTIDTSLKRGVLVVSVDGEFDMHVTDDFRQIVDTALNTSEVKRILLNLAGVTFIDSSGIGVILGRYKKVCALGGVMLAVNIQPQILRIFELSGLLKFIKVYNSETEALDAL